jgi:hypothetical protein
MAVNLSPVGGVAAQFFTNTGAVLTGGKLYTYLAGTTTPAVAYTSSQGNVAWTNPIVLDAAGRVSGSGEIWLTDGIIYKFVLKDANDVLIATYDNITGINSNSVAFVNQQQIITATAGQTVFNLSISFQPGTNSLSVFVDGVNQYGPGAQYAYTETDSDTVTFVSGLHVGAEVKFTTTQQQSAGAVDSSQVTYDPPFTGSVATNVEARLAQTVSVKDFGATGDGTTDDFDAMLAAWNYAYPIGANLYFPSGTYVVAGERSFPFNQGSGTITSLLDCNDMTIFGDGPSTILKTVSVGGADVLQLNGLKNFHVRDMQVQSVVTGSASGSNGLSVTGGFDNITVDNFWAYNLGFVDKTTYVDGGGAVSIQPPSEPSTTVMGSFKATNIFADGCVYGFAYQPDNDFAFTQPVSIDVNLVVSNARQGVVVAGSETTSAVSANSTNGVRVRGQSINCMQDVAIGRVFGVDIDMQIIQTKTAAQLLLSPDGTQWTAVDTTADVIGVICTYAKNSRIVAYGNKKDCRHKAKIGGAFDPNSGQGGNTNNCDFYFDITGTAASVDIQFNDAGGNIMNNSRLYVTLSTATTLPIEFYDPALDNTITIGPDTRIQNVALTGQIGWTQADGRTVNNFKYMISGNLSTRQTGSAAASAIVEQWVDDTQNRKFAIRNDGGVLTASRSTASAVATINTVVPIYSESNVLVGYVPVYTTFTP